MRRYLAYLGYVLRHKWFVFVESCRLGIPRRGLVHDLSKFRPGEFLPYARFFHELDGRKRQRRSPTGYYKPTDTGDLVMDFAWLRHQKVNDHHWQWWVLPEDEGGVKVLPMSIPARLEMLADWRGAGRAQGTPDVRAWYTANGSKMQLHPDTRKWVEDTLGLAGT